MDATPWMNRLVDRLSEMGALTSPAVEAALRRVPRHRFLETFYRSPATDGNGEGGRAPESVLVTQDLNAPRADDLDFIYSSQAITTRRADDLPTSSSSDPALVASMLEHLDLRPGMRVLEIGTGTGWNAALMAELVRDPTQIVTVDIQEDVVAQTRRLLAAAGYDAIRVLARDGVVGAPEFAPFDRIVATVGCPDLAPPWAAQLAPAGFMLIPLLHAGPAPLVRVWQEDGRLLGRVIAGAGFVRMQGELAHTQPWDTRSDATRDALLRDVQRRPLFEELRSDQPPAERWRAYVGFTYGLAASDRRAFWSWRPTGCGLYDPAQGVALVSLDEDAVLLNGDPSLYDHVRAMHAAWQQLGRPAVTDYRHEFRLRSEPANTRADGWVVERTFYRQHISVGLASVS